MEAASRVSIEAASQDATRWRSFVTSVMYESMAVHGSAWKECRNKYRGIITAVSYALKQLGICTVLYSRPTHVLYVAWHGQVPEGGLGTSVVRTYVRGTVLYDRERISQQTWSFGHGEPQSLSSLQFFQSFTDWRFNMTYLDLEFQYRVLYRVAPSFPPPPSPNPIAVCVTTNE